MSMAEPYKRRVGYTRNPRCSLCNHPRVIFDDVSPDLVVCAECDAAAIAVAKERC